MTGKCFKCGREIPEYVRQNGRGVMLKFGHGWKHIICPKRSKRDRKAIPKTKQPRFGLGVDWQARAELALRGYLHPDSLVMRDGREILEGDDYKKRVREVEERDGHKCQRKRDYKGGVAGDFGICGRPANGRPHHIVKRSKGRDDRAANLMSVCDPCHSELHPEFRTRFSRRKP